MGRSDMAKIDGHEGLIIGKRIMTPCILIPPVAAAVCPLGPLPRARPPPPPIPTPAPPPTRSLAVASRQRAPIMPVPPPLVPLHAPTPAPPPIIPPWPLMTPLPAASFPLLLPTPTPFPPPLAPIRITMSMRPMSPLPPLPPPLSILRLLRLLALHLLTEPPPRLNLHLVAPRRILVRRRQSQRFRHRLLLRLLKLLHLIRLLLLPLPLVLRVPRQVPPLLPPPHGRLEAVAEVVLAVRRVGDLVPAEVDAAPRPGLADGGDEIHGLFVVRGRFRW